MIDPLGLFIDGGVISVPVVIVMGTAAIATAYVAGQYLQDIYENWNNDPFDDPFFDNKASSCPTYQAEGRSPYPPGKRNKSKSKKDAREKAKKAGKGKDPIHHPGGEYGPHYHPDVPMPKPDQITPKKPNPHDHYYYPK